MDQTARFALPFLAPGQMQKEFYHNEALQLIDTLLCPVVEGPPTPSPPASPIIGTCFLIANDATGAWSGQDGALACFTDGGWRFAPSVEGISAFDRVSGQVITRRFNDWEVGVVRGQEVQINGQVVLRSRQASIPEPTGGSIVDVECRSAVMSIVAVLKAHGLIA